MTERTTKFYLWRGLVVALVLLFSLLLLPFGTVAAQVAWFSIPVGQYVVRRRYATKGQV